jgi:tRNA (Thr-GGU) A37 N-methylase
MFCDSRVRRTLLTGPVRRLSIDGTPVLDIKPVMEEFLPRSALRQPQWSHELMRHCWQLR